MINNETKTNIEKWFTHKCFTEWVKEVSKNKNKIVEYPIIEMDIEYLNKEHFQTEKIICR